MAGTSRNNHHLFVDDFYFSALIESEGEIFPISDEKYAEELQLQEALVASALSSRIRTRLSKTEGDSHNHKVGKRGKTEPETGESSSLFCPICMDAKPASEMFRNTACSHSFCLDCIAKHVAVKIQDNISTVKCPDFNCQGVLHLNPDFCRQILPQQLFDRWENAMCESLILGSEKFYCPFKDCSAMLVDDGGERVTMSECPNCHRLFCAQCKVSWHCGLECREFRRLEEEEERSEREDLMVMELAKKKKWRRCPNCKFFVEKRDGCLHIACRYIATLCVCVITYKSGCSAV
ncbi:hypothetical protein Vadar_006934 [Vaccinium darrowii]|uniref:Uncharacterized protein n=1 Tax=Vaccinium darrowii TaxID=229202 RepID=A0ACB7YTQ4_9ERIC|nr:hypothetical protein Vadar_006934 [Vaccinium darrowii]